VENVKGDWMEMRRQMEGDLDKEVGGRFGRSVGGAGWPRRCRSGAR